MQVCERESAAKAWQMMSVEVVSDLKNSLWKTKDDAVVKRGRHLSNTILFAHSTLGQGTESKKGRTHGLR